MDTHLEDLGMLYRHAVYLQCRAAVRREPAAEAVASELSRWIGDLYRLEGGSRERLAVLAVEAAQLVKDAAA